MGGFVVCLPRTSVLYAAPVCSRPLYPPHTSSCLVDSSNRMHIQHNTTSQTSLSAAPHPVKHRPSHLRFPSAQLPSIPLPSSLPSIVLLPPAPYSTSSTLPFCLSLTRRKCSYVPSKPLICSSTPTVLPSPLLTNGLTSFLLKFSRLPFSATSFPLCSISKLLFRVVFARTLDRRSLFFSYLRRVAALGPTMRVQREERSSPSRRSWVSDSRMTVRWRLRNWRSMASKREKSAVE